MAAFDESIAPGIGTILGGLFGSNGAGDDIAAIINAGNKQPNMGMYPQNYAPVQAQMQQNNSTILYIVGGVVLLVIILLVVKK